METCLKLIEHILSNYGTNPEITNWVNNIEIFFVPMLNPEGWIYLVEEAYI